MGILSTSSLGALNSTVTADNLDTNGSLGIIISGTWAGTISFQGSLDGINFSDILALSLNGTFSTSTAVNGSFILNLAALRSVRVKMTSYISGSATATIQLGGTSGLLTALSTVSGNTDGTRIGNVGDRLKVDASITGVGSNIVTSFNSKVRADVYTTPAVAINSNVTYTTLYSYSGTGFLIGFNIEFNGVNIVVKLAIDGETIFDGNDLSVLNSLLATADAQYRRQGGSGIITQSSSLDWSLKHPISFSSNVTISARLSGGASKNFQQGIFYIAKVT